MKTRWDAFKQLDEEYMHKKLGSVLYEGKSTNDDQEKAKVINRRFINKVQELQSQGFDFIIAGDWNARSLTWNDSGSNKHGIMLRCWSNCWMFRC